MMRSLYAGVSGLKTHQTKMDVIGNNIANVNTVGYKSQTVTFQDVMYQTTQAASGANAATGVGGTNAKQIGLGVTTGAISNTITTPGATQTTNNPFDIKLNGDSFFVVSDGSQNYFTKAGNFTVDSTGNLVMSTTGYNVMGWQVDTTGKIVQAGVSPLKVMSTENQTSNPEATTKARFTGIVDKNNDNVNNAAGYTSILEFYDNLGYSYRANFTIHNASGKNVGGATRGDGDFYMVLDSVTDTAGKAVNMADIGVSFGNGTALDVEGTGVNNAILINYNQDDEGNLSSIGGVAGTTTATLNFAQGAGQKMFENITIDMSASKMKGNKGVMTAAMSPGDADEAGKGRLLGKMNGISIDKYGKIFGSYSNGDSKLLGQIAVAQFSNPSGLSKEGNNIYSTTLNSGGFDGVGVDVSASGGSMATGVLEMSNVDLSSEFTEMITTQRGFQANSRIITVSDTMIEELVNLKRS